MAKRSSSSRKRRAPARRSVVIVNAPKRRRSARRYGRRNPPVLSVGGVLGRVVSGAIGGGVIVATEAAARLIRKRALGMTAGEILSDATELGITTAAGLATEYFVGGPTGARFGDMIVSAGFASVIRSRLKASKAPWVSDALADDGRRRNFDITPDGRVVARRMNGYVPGAAARARVAAAPMNGYVSGQNNRRPLGGYVPGAGGAEMAAAFRVASGG